MPIISYAQNFEDVLLNRVFYGKKNGFYIDVGAAHPEIFSVTKCFYDQGWSGINIEPIPSFYEKLKTDRPRDVNLNIALGSKLEIRTFYESVFHEASSFFPENVKSANSMLEYSPSENLINYQIEVRTLSDICSQYCDKTIDFLKIDVEGFEKEVLEGANFDKFRPIIIVIEATKPNSGIDPFSIMNNLETSKWEYILTKHRYKKVYFDGMNCFYLREENLEFEKAFCVPVHTYEFIFPIYKLKNKEEDKKILPQIIYESALLYSNFNEAIEDMENKNRTLKEELSSFNHNYIFTKRQLFNAQRTIEKNRISYEYVIENLKNLQLLAISFQEEIHRLRRSFTMRFNPFIKPSNNLNTKILSLISPEYEDIFTEN